MPGVDSISLRLREPYRLVGVYRVRFMSSCLGLLLCTCLWGVFMPEVYGSTRLKTDVVYMKNGDKITCEIRSLEQGQLTIKQEYANSTVALDWEKVDRIETQQPFVVADTRGNAFNGILSEKTDQSFLTIVGSTTGKISHDEVVSIQQTGETFVRRLKGSIDLGLDFAQSNSQKNLTLQSDLTYQATRQFFAVTSSSQFTSQQETNNTSETTVKSEYFHQLRKSNWYGGGIANFLSSSEQQISLRSTFGGALAIRPVYTNKTNLSLIGALAYTSEKDASNATSTASTQALDSAVAVQFSTFRFDSTNFATTVWIYPSLTSPGRVRMTINQDVYYKFYKDFYVRASFYSNYDNRPVVGAPSNNLGASSTVGWSFR
ncbi:uncharacterized protein DUF481 [Edaphobacter aggregans]|uniref:Uncharacterized protein DUF481 n=2 Tax=Edaphobacter aggregans TaxID=570835 RepID=A0A3R9Q7Y0_9BACT|nr:uncharacterized protein DUF481 [Edaphobacter aggregans]